VLDTK